MNKNNNIENDGLKGNNPFKTGNDYFENFNSKLQSRIGGFEEIKTIAPTLSNIPKYNPFEVPMNYFDELPTIIQQHCIESKPSTSILEWLVLLIKPRFAIPVLATLLIAIAGINYVDKNAGSSKQEMAQELSEEEQLYNIDEDIIVESLASYVTAENKKITEDDNNIENYLIDNHVDEKNLNNEL